MRRRPPLRLLRLANPAVRLVLRSPLRRLLDGSLMLLTYRGPRSGRQFTIPIMYARVAETIVALAVAPETKRWWRTFREGAPAILEIEGRSVEMRGALVDSDEAREALRAYLVRFPRAGSTLGARPDAPDAVVDTAASRVAIVVFSGSP